MTWWSYPCNCAVWVQANRCAGNTSNLRVFVHENDLPASLQWFAYDSSSSQRNCWSIDPAGLRVCLPRDDDVHIARPGDLYSDCATCEALPELPDSPGGPPGSSPPGSGGGGGSGGGEPGQLPDVPDPKGIKVSVCADHLARAQARGWPTDKLYVYAKDELASASVIQVAGICIDVPMGPLVTPPADALWLGLGQDFDSCSDCTDGVQAVLCAADANLPGAENAPELWIRKSDLAEVGSGFAYGVWCYDVPAGPIVTIPENARIYKPTRELDCASCNRGVRYERCPGEPDPGVEYWADAEEITRLLSDFPTLTHIYIRIAGVCHSLDLAATSQRIPLDAKRVAPRCLYLNCQACICGSDRAVECPERPRGIPVRLCAGQPAAQWRGTWLREDAIPDGTTWFVHRGWCVYVDPSEPVSEAPDDMEVIDRIDNDQPNCTACMDNTYPPPDTPDPLPPWTPPIPKDRYYHLRRCSDGTPTNNWLRESHVCGVWNIVPCDIRNLIFKVQPSGIGTPQCMQVFGPPQPQALGPIANAWIVDGPFSDCCDCDNTLPGCSALYTLSDCDSVEADIVTDTDLSSYVGQVIKIDGSDACWQVSEGGSGTPQSVTVVKSHATCGDCSPSPAPCECPDGLADSYTVSFTWNFGYYFGVDCTGSPEFACTSVPVSVVVTRSGSFCIWTGSTEEAVCEGAGVWVELRLVPPMSFGAPPCEGTDCTWEVRAYHGAFFDGPGVATKESGSSPVGSYASLGACCQFDSMTFAAYIKSSINGASVN